MPKSKTEKSYLVLGWRVTPTLDPEYWLEEKPKAGNQRPEQLVRIPADSVSSHTAIIAQSGSGKSFFLGRLIEELMLRTRARCVVLDPNADYRRIHEVADASIWEKAKYDLIKRIGTLPHEKTQKEFKEQWSNVPVLIRTGEGDLTTPYEMLKVHWTTVSVDFLAEDASPTLRSELYHCHSFVQALELLCALKSKSEGTQLDLIDKAEELLKQQTKSDEEFRAILTSEFDVEKLSKAGFDIGKLLKAKPSQVAEIVSLIPNLLPAFFPVGLELASSLLAAGLVEGIQHLNKSVGEKQLRASIERNMDRAVEARRYIRARARMFYFGKAREYKTANILETQAQEQVVNNSQITARQRAAAGSLAKRLQVIDLPALRDKQTRFLAINSILETEWIMARTEWASALNKDKEQDDRVPTFIIIDEAHNLIPADPTSRVELALREQFRTIVAEGRKYGLFLIVVSQRPDKLDPLILSECENKAIMRLSSRSVLDISRQRLGLEDIPSKLLEKCLEFDTGRVLLIGNWAPAGPQFLYGATLRTVEGGRNLRKQYWATSVVSQPVSKGSGMPRDQQKSPASKNDGTGT